jgi:alcohol dehydrogenase, propanol-preferring
MKAMVLKKLRMALEWTDLPDLYPGPGEIRVEVLACGVCRTDLHVVDGARDRYRYQDHEISAQEGQ